MHLFDVLHVGRCIMSWLGKGKWWGLIGWWYYPPFLPGCWLQDRWTWVYCQFIVRHRAFTGNYCTYLPKDSKDELTWVAG